MEIMLDQIKRNYFELQNLFRHKNSTTVD